MNRFSHPAGLTWAVTFLVLLAGCSDEMQLLQPPEEVVIDSPAKLIEALTRAYQRRDSVLLASLLSNPSEGDPEYLFLLGEPSDTGETQWGYHEEVRIHQRMFHPEHPPPGDGPVPNAVWLQSLSINLSPNEIFSERHDLYSQNGGADGKLDPALWRATDASYSTDLFFDLAGDTDYTVNGTSNFLVIENLQKRVGESGKFLLFAWDEMDVSIHGETTSSSRPTSVESETWGSVKALYR